MRPGRAGCAVDADCVAVSDRRHRDGLLLGLLRARLGRLLVPGIRSRTRPFLPLARRNRHAAFGHRHGEALRAEDLDGVAGPPDLLAVVFWAPSSCVRALLTSVHAFATDPTRGRVFILGILVFFIGGSLTLFALRANRLTSGGLFHPISREGALGVEQLFLSTATATVPDRHGWLSTAGGGGDRR